MERGVDQHEIGSGSISQLAGWREQRSEVEGRVWWRGVGFSWDVSWLGRRQRFSGENQSLLNDEGRGGRWSVVGGRKGL